MWSTWLPGVNTNVFRARAAGQRVVAEAADQRVPNTFSTDQDVVAGAAIECVDPHVADDHVGEARADDVLDLIVGIALCVAAEAALREVHRDGGRARVAYGVNASVAVEEIRARTAVEQVVALASREMVVSRAAIEQVVAAKALDKVRTARSRRSRRFPRCR